MHNYPVSLGLVALLVPLMGLVACGGAGSSAASPSAQAGDKYPIVLHRDLEPGKTYRLRVEDESTEHSVTSIAGKVVDEKNTTTLFSLVGSHKTLSAGRYQPGEYVIEELTRTTNGDKTALLPTGSKVSENLVGKQWQYTVAGKPVSEQATKALHALLQDTEGASSDDDIFGSKLPRAIGESWPVDVHHLPPLDESIVVNPEGASGSTRLVALRKLDGVDCLELRGELSVPSMTLKDLPEGAKLLSGGVSGNFVGMAPVDTNLPSPSVTRTIDVKLKMEVPSPRGAVTVDMTVHNEHSHKRN
ncbi:MAG TPA: hypothetical protein VJV79_36315 [Polyangiaceae bacterium]|nr:hypothetical protein [Polyangiaceae bacterium]